MTRPIHIRATDPDEGQVQANIKHQAKVYTPLVFARKGGQERFHGYPMVPRGKDRYQARLPSSFSG